jgi:hypothetical protein
MPERISCTPVACIAGKVMAACAKDADCDSSPGIGDCDACAIKGGPTTENEMSALMPWYVMPPKPGSREGRRRDMSLRDGHHSAVAFASFYCHCPPDSCGLRIRNGCRSSPAAQSVVITRSYLARLREVC